MMGKFCKADVLVLALVLSLGAYLGLPGGKEREKA